MDLHNNYGETYYDEDKKEYVDNTIKPGIYMDSKDELWVLEGVVEVAVVNNFLFNITLKSGVILTSADKVNKYATVEGQRQLVGEVFLLVQMRGLDDITSPKAMKEGKRIKPKFIAYRTFKNTFKRDD